MDALKSSDFINKIKENQKKYNSYVFYDECAHDFLRLSKGERFNIYKEDVNLIYPLTVNSSKINSIYTSDLVQYISENNIPISSRGDGLFLPIISLACDNKTLFNNFEKNEFSNNKLSYNFDPSFDKKSDEEKIENFKFFQSSLVYHVGNRNIKGETGPLHSFVLGDNRDFLNQLLKNKNIIHSHEFPYYMKMQKRVINNYIDFYNNVHDSVSDKNRVKDHLKINDDFLRYIFIHMDLPSKEICKEIYVNDVILKEKIDKIIKR